MKYRIKYKKGRYYPQYRQFFFWRGLKEPDYDFSMSCGSLDRAINKLDEVIPILESNKIIPYYPEQSSAENGLSHVEES